MTKRTKMYKTVFIARDQDILSFLHWPHHVLAIFSKVYPVRNRQNVLISGWKLLFRTNSCTLLKTLKSGVPSGKMTKHADVGLKMLFHTNSCTLLKTLKNGVPSAKMPKRTDLGLKKLFCRNSWTSLKIAKRWCTQCENDKTCWSRAENAVLDRLVHFAQNC